MTGSWSYVSTCVKNCRRLIARSGVVPVASAVLVQPLPADDAQSDDRRLVVTMTGREFFSLRRLAAHYGLPGRAVLERLDRWEDHSVVQSLGEDDTAVNRYLIQ
ncbi:hypothetical protein [Paraburkholderia humisilvae]|uniref:Uncharacterized protein n=1 Tax=Paraburkholderia humisilvae TaxID=627669 RepID=A0A6J5FAG6_9BURK|nr:hypothetical protein [Paraburkholderia humisilvae]CAB3774672.1 hypothetical protein LMG29542_08050 [Paraburkholderia humisilvae]